MTGAPIHKPVLLDEAVDYLAVRPGGVYADMTLGLGGHSIEILDRLMGSGRLIAFDKDAEAIAIAESRLAGHGGVFDIVHSDFRHAAGVLVEEGIDGLDGFLMDLGVSMMQLKTPERGFGLMAEGNLDMRMDTDEAIGAADLVNTLPEEELANVIFRYGQERRSRPIASRIVKARAESPIRTTTELAQIVESAIPRRFWPDRIHPATRTFQALRIAVNDELGALTDGLESLIEMLRPGGRAVVISYHSLEDGIVKNIFRKWAKGCICPPGLPACACGREPGLRLLTRKPVSPGPEELEQNPSARSARLRAAERI